MNLPKLPPICLVYVSGLKRGVFVHRNELGFKVPVFYYSQADVILNNTLNGITPAQYNCMLIGSYFGFDCPGANPDIYNEDGTVLPEYADVMKPYYLQMEMEEANESTKH